MAASNELFDTLMRFKAVITPDIRPNPLVLLDRAWSSLTPGRLRLRVQSIRHFSFSATKHGNVPQHPAFPAPEGLGVNPHPITMCQPLPNPGMTFLAQDAQRITGGCVLCPSGGFCVFDPCCCPIGDKGYEDAQQNRLNRHRRQMAEATRSTVRPHPGPSRPPPRISNPTIPPTKRVPTNSQRRVPAKTLPVQPVSDSAYVRRRTQSHV